MTEAELRLMRVLWNRGHGTVQNVVDGIGGGDRPAYNTVLTTLRILERKGYVRHEKEGRAFVYHPLVGRGDARREAVRDVVRRFFEGSPEALVLNLMEHDDLSASELERIRRLLDAAERGP